MIGLETGKVLLVEYDNQWPLYYQQEAELIKQTLGGLVVDIQHIGSTSIIGLKSKPIIDVLVGLKSFEHINEVIEKMVTAGYIYADKAGIPNDYTFRKGANIATHLIHVVEYGKPNWIHNLKFRDTLKNNPVLIKQYAALKANLANEFPNSREKYTEGKGQFISEVVSNG